MKSSSTRGSRPTARTKRSAIWTPRSGSSEPSGSGRLGRTGGSISRMRRGVSARGDWCIHLDSDEFIPDWEFEPIRQHLAHTTDRMIPVKFTNFYGNCRVYHSDPAKSHWITQKMIIHRNVVDEFEFWGDGSNLRRKRRNSPGIHRARRSTCTTSVAFGTPGSCASSGGRRDAFEAGADPVSASAVRVQPLSAQVG